jgi:hypothetical protein
VRGEPLEDSIAGTGSGLVSHLPETGKNQNRGGEVL